ncbi:MAG TPA: hypothetical protein ENI23_05880 [bacterium]|nr:hypothetical protein [bacterium]
MAGNIQINKFSGTLSSRDEILTKINSFVNQFAPIMKISISLPKNVESASADILYSKAAEYRAYLDNATTFLLLTLLLRLQIKNASMLAAKLYKEELQVVYKSAKPEILAARGYEEKEMLARAHMPEAIKSDKDFWEKSLSDVDDLADLVRLKMRSFKGGLDTILQQAGLLKISASLRGLVLSSEQLEVLNIIKQKQSQPTFTQPEGEVSLD